MKKSSVWKKITGVALAAVLAVSPAVLAGEIDFTDEYPVEEFELFEEESPGASEGLELFEEEPQINSEDLFVEEDLLVEEQGVDQNLDFVSDLPVLSDEIILDEDIETVADIAVDLDDLAQEDELVFDSIDASLDAESVAD